MENKIKSPDGNSNEQVKTSKILSMAKRRGILWPAYEIYGGLAGFYDYGPIGSGLRENIISIWRKYFVFGERCAEIVTTDVTPEEVFIASGHVDEFKDLMVQCNKCKSAFRADHLVKNLEENSDNLTVEELTNILNDNNITCPDCGGDLTSPRPVNLMFETEIGLGNPRRGYLRPETAQGMFINFQQLYRYFREKLPFGAAQVGHGFRNEISPRQGIIRLREMTMAELEYFFNPKEENFDGVNELSNENLLFIPEPDKEIQINIKDALKKQIIDSEIMAYFIGLTKRFLIEVGLDENKLRFRKHQQNEMAHYAQECWDAEANTSIGWIEIVGIANRSAFDLSAHIKATGQELSAFIPYDKPIERDVEKLVIDMKSLGPLFKSEAGKIKSKLESMPIDQIDGEDAINIKIDDQMYKIPKNCFSIQKSIEKISGERIIPNVLEPSFGIDRIFYTLLEHSYTELELTEEIDSDEELKTEEIDSGDVYRILKLPPWVAPVKVGVFPLMPKDGLVEIAQKINNTLRKQRIQTHYDESGSIGRRYARMDEIGTPFCITVDYDTKGDESVTIRDRNSHNQVRIEIIKIPELLDKLIRGTISFTDLN